VKALRWTRHATDNLADREIDRSDADRTLVAPEFVVPDRPPRQVYMRRYFDQVLRQDMLLRVVVEDTPTELVVVTLYKTSQIAKYLRGLTP
jgi:hypothetical protein